MNGIPAADMPIEEVPLDVLRAMQLAAAARMDSAKADIAGIQAEISRRLGESVKRAFEQAGKEHGTLTLPLQDGLTAKCDISKKVDWDSAALMAVAQTMPWDRVNAIFKIRFEVSETVYKGIEAADPDLKGRIDKARTVTFGTPKIALAKAETGA